MKLRSKILASVIGTLAVIVPVYGYFFLYRPYKKVFNTEHFDPYSLPSTEVREGCHIALVFRDHHDAAILLQEYGNKDSVPLLIDALEREKPDKESGRIICTVDHCVDALKAITGQSLGYDYDLWRKWWNETGCNLPRNEFNKKHPDPALMPPLPKPKSDDF